jgi:hypothetical protein
LAFCVALAAVAAGLFAGVQWQRVEQETQRANVTLAKSYWASAVNAQTAGNPLRAAHFFARSGALTSDPSELKNAILAVHYHPKPFFLGFQMTHGAHRVKISFTSVGNSTGRWRAGSLSDNTHPLEYNKRPIFSLALGWRHWRGQTISPN